MDYSEFETKAFLRHGYKYDYSRVNVVNNRTKVEILCNKHGSFFQAPDHHIRGRGCPACAKEARGPVDKPSSSEFFKRATEIHSGFYDYSKSTFTKLSDKIDIICPIHGPFSTLARKHLSEKRGCPTCGRVKNRYSRSVMFQDFIDRSIDRHGYAYSYAETSLRFLSDDIDVICPVHGPFTVVASDHIHGRGCPKCRPNGSTPENELADFIHGLGFDIVRNTRKVIPPLELDIVIPDLRIAFEFNGIFWHSEQAGKSTEYHRKKTEAARSSGYRLFHVYESDWDLERDRIKDRIAKVLFPDSSANLSQAYPLESYCGTHLLMMRGLTIARFRTDNGVAVDSYSMYGLEAIALLMKFSQIRRIQVPLDWPEYSIDDFTSNGFEKYMNVRPGRLYFDRKTLRRLKGKPRDIPGLEFFSVVDSGSTIWELQDRVSHDIPENSSDGA